jgi:hypothetical protein
MWTDTRVAADTSRNYFSILDDGDDDSRSSMDASVRNPCRSCRPCG